MSLCSNLYFISNTYHSKKSTVYGFHILSVDMLKLFCSLFTHFDVNILISKPKHNTSRQLETFKINCLNRSDKASFCIMRL